MSRILVSVGRRDMYTCYVKILPATVILMIIYQYEYAHKEWRFFDIQSQNLTLNTNNNNLEPSSQYNEKEANDSQNYHEVPGVCSTVRS